MSPSYKPTLGIERLMRPHLFHLEGYEPIVPLEVLSEQVEVPVERLIKLDGNENPYGCSPRVREALARYPFYHIYPESDHQELRKTLERYVGVSADHILLGSGSDELIDLILRLFLEPGDRVINCVPTFGMYPFITEVCGGEIVNLPRDESFNLDLPSVKAAIDQRTKLIFIASPNNPTGNVAPEGDILELVKMGIGVVVDEAYCEFSGTTVAPLVPRYENLMVLRTFSKWAGLAGLRAGYGIFPLRIARLLQRMKPPYNVNVAALIAMGESLADMEYLQGTVKAIVAERERLLERLGEVDFLKPLPSQANFILCSVLKGEAKQIHQRLKKKGIFLRYFDTPLLRNFLRISVGKPEHTEALIGALKEEE